MANDWNSGRREALVWRLNQFHCAVECECVIFFKQRQWQPDEDDDSQVRFVGWVNKGGDGETVHMLYNGGVHFDRMLAI